MTSPGRSIRRRLHGMVFRLPLMITCNQFEDFILAWLDGDLPRKQKMVFEKHLRMCRECRDYLKAYEACMALAKDAFRIKSQLLPEDVPQDLVEAILAARNA